MIIIEGTTLQVAENNILEVGSTDVQIVTETTDVPVVAEFIQGPEGPSAYTIAKRNGFTGTEEEWLNQLNEAAKQHTLNSLEGQKGVANGIAPLNASNKLPTAHLPDEAALKTDVPKLIVKESGHVVSNLTNSINFTGAPVKVTSSNSDVTVSMFGTYTCTCSATTSPGIVSGQAIRLNMSGASRQVGGSITAFEVTDWTGTVHTYTASSNSAVSADIVATGTVGDVLSLSVVAIDDLGNHSLPTSKSVTVVTNSAPTGVITVNVPTSVDTASTGNQMSFTGLSDSDGTTFTYTITNISDPGFIVSKSTGIADSEVITFTAPTLTTSETTVTFNVKGVDTLGAETAAMIVTIPVIFSRAVGVVLKSTGGGGGTLGQIDGDGNDIPTKDATYFSNHASFQTSTVVIDGQIMVRFPKFYYKAGIISGGVNNGKAAWWISDKPRPGFSVHPAFMKNGAEINQFYMGAYLGSISNNMLQSISGGTVAGSTTAAQFKMYANNRNVGGVTGFQVMDIWQVSAVLFLYLIENRTFSSSSPFSYRGVSYFGGGNSSIVFIDGIKTDASNKLSIFDLNGNRTFVNTNVALPSNVYYPVTYKTGQYFDATFFMATGTTTLSSATAPDETDLMTNMPYGAHGWTTDPAQGMFSINVSYDGTSAPSVTARLTKV